MIVPGSASSFAPRIAAFRQGLSELGYVEGRSIIVEYRFADGRPERFPALADELVRLDVRVIVTMGTPATLAAKEASEKVPIVMANLGEAVDLGIVASLAHPGGNVTGSSYLMLVLVIKRLEALKEMLPNVTRAAVLSDPINPLHDRALRGLETAARPLGLTLHLIAARDLAEIESAVSTMARKGIRALVVLDDGVFVHHRVRLASLAIQSRMATINGLEEEVEAGGLMAYLPVEQPTKFELVINRKTAKSTRPDNPADDPPPGRSGHRVIMSAALTHAAMKMGYDRVAADRATSPLLGTRESGIECDVGAFGTPHCLLRARRAESAQGSSSGRRPRFMEEADDGATSRALLWTRRA